MKTLPAIPNRRKTYYKIMNDDECHKGLQYHDGLVIDPVEFNDDPKISCVKGGIYFTTKEYLHRFFNYGKIIRPVTIPSDAKVVLDPNGDKYRADRLFFYPKKDMDFYFDKWFDKTTFPKKDYWRLAYHCSKHFDKWFDKENFPKKDYWRLIEYCQNHFDKWFNKETFPKNEYWRLAKFCKKHFDKWFDKEIFLLEDYYYYYLAVYCFGHFDKWFNKTTFPKRYYYYLAAYCPEYRPIWDK